MGKVLVFLGLGIAGLGLLIMLGLPIGRLPGDIYVKRDGFSFYFPLTTSIVLSVVLTLLNVVDEPLATLPLERIRPGRDALEEIMEGLR